MPHQCTDCGRAFADGSKEMLSGCPDCGGNKFQFLPERAVDGNAGGAGGAASAATAPKKTPEEAPATATDAPETGGGGRSRSGTNGRSKSGSNDQASAVNRAAATVREWVSVRDDSNDDDTGRAGSTRNDRRAADRPEDDQLEDDQLGDDHPEETPSKPSSEIDRPASEDSAQASARRDVVSKSELPDEPARGKTVSDTDTSSESSAVSETGAVSDTGTISDTGPVSNTEAVSDSGTVSQSGAVPDNGSEAPETHDDENVVDAPKNENPGLKELREELNSQFESIRIVNPGHYELNLMELYEREEYIISLQEDGKYVIEVPDAWEQTER